MNKKSQITLDALGALSSLIDGGTDKKSQEIRPKLDNKGRAYGTGKRKDAIARVWVSEGEGIIVNGKTLNDYFSRLALRSMVTEPMRSVDQKFQVEATVAGGGLSGQAGALRHGLAKAIEKLNPSLRSSLKAAGLLTRDPRVVERKKYGQRGARARFQFSKR